MNTISICLSTHRPETLTFDLVRHLSRILPSSWRRRTYSVDRQILKLLGHHNGMLFSPGDQLNIANLRAEHVAEKRWPLLCALARAAGEAARVIVSRFATTAHHTVSSEPIPNESLEQKGHPPIA